MSSETLEQFLERAKRLGFHPEAIARILMWKFHMTRGDAEKVAAVAK
jgi:hypothetical protein